MVSTRQMSTSSSSSAAGCDSNSNSNNINSAVAAAYESARLSVVTRQTSSNYVLVNCSTIPPPPQHRSLNSTTAVASSMSTVTTRHGVRSTDYSSDLDANSAALQCVPQLLDMPTEILSKILSYTSYKKVGQLRVVSRKMNDVCMHILNSTFSKLITQTYNRFHAIKANMPRRESARRTHPLACECDITETCYMRLSLLQMAFGKHIERGHCCFFPGAILDEVYTILHYINTTPRLERPYRVTDELFDLSTMAMEYFRDHIEQTLPGIGYFQKEYFDLPTTTKRLTNPLSITTDRSDNSSSMPSPPQSNMVLRKGIRKIKQGMKIYNNQLSLLRNELRTCKRKSTEQGKQIAEQQKLITEQQKQSLEYASRLDETEKKYEEMARKFSTLLQELNKCKTELQYWRSKSPAMPMCTQCGQKFVPMLPPEDYQALINQGVKPENIILQCDTDTDVEENEGDAGEGSCSNAAVGGGFGGCNIAAATATATAASSETNVAVANCRTIDTLEFALPDETTTAKLLAINTAHRNLKRQHSTTKSHTNTKYTATHSDNPISVAGDDQISMEAMGSNSKINTSAVTAAAAAADHVHKHTNSGRCNRNLSESDEKQSKSASDGLNTDSIDVDNTKKAIEDNNAQGSGTHIIATIDDVGGTNAQQPHKGVIISPSMLAGKVQAATNIVDVTDDGFISSNGHVRTNATSICCGNGVAGIAGDTGCTNSTIIMSNNISTDGGGGYTGNIAAVGVEDVNTLQAIISHETKKARRVQKATRYLNGSGKRSK